MFISLLDCSRIMDSSQTVTRTKRSTSRFRSQNRRCGSRNIALADLDRISIIGLRRMRIRVDDAALRGKNNALSDACGILENLKTSGRAKLG